MRLEQTPRPGQTVRVNARLITSSTILHLSSDELERAVDQEQEENPALEVREQHICLFCGAIMYSASCMNCGHFVHMEQMPFAAEEQSLYYEHLLESQRLSHQQAFFDIDNYGFAEVDGEDAYDPLARIATGETLEEALLRQLLALVPPEDAPLAEQLVGNLNEHGYLDIDLQEIACYMQIPLERVERVLRQLQTLEPPGIGARTPRECLLIQLHALSERKAPHPLAAILIERYLDQLGRNQFHEIARDIKQPEHEVRKAGLYIKSMLHPFPAYMYRAEDRYTRPGSGAAYVRPDVIIRRSETGFEVEVIEEKRYDLRVASSYSGRAGYAPYSDTQRYIHHYSDRARFFVDCIHRRWRTLKQVVEFIVGYQRSFLEKGVRSLRPLTRAEVAQQLDLDEGTVSRATAHKYALLPNGRLIPISDFFDSSLSVKDVLRELILAELPGHRLSDEELARLLTARGIPMARRTVTKYREEMGIGSSRERGQSS